MPFTLSHAAAAIPFRKLRPVWPALVIGTFAPDLQYFIWISDEDRSGHHFPGILLLSIPLALLLLWLFERFVKGPAIELLPESLQRRLQDKVQPLSFRGWRQFASIVLWIAVGVATHILWDQFTHQHTWMTAHWDLLHQAVPIPFRAPAAMTKVLQHASTVLGLLVLVAWVAAWYRRTAPVPLTSFHPMSTFKQGSIVFTMAAIACLAGYPLAIFRVADHPLRSNRLFMIVTVFEAVTLIFCTQVLIYGIGRTIGARSRRMPATQLDDQKVRS
jgi:Domain of unknown function (DUF4184)